MTTTNPNADIRFSLPLYTMAEAARALGVPSTTFANWAKGYQRRFPGRTPVTGAAVVTVLPEPAGRPAVPFVGLAEGMILAAIRRAGVPLQRIRPALDVLRSEIGLDHALASKAVFTDGAEVLFDYASHGAGSDGDAVGELVVVRSGQHVFVPVVQEYLQRISYGSDGYARLIRLPAYDRAEVIADPQRSFGQPVFAHGGARVSEVLDRFWAGEAIVELAAEFGTPAAEIEDVLRAASRSAA